MKFPTRYSEKKRQFSKTGERYVIEYQLVIDETGKEVLEPCGQTDFYQMIQSHRDSVDLDLVLDRLKRGDSTALNKVQGFYADVSDLPVKMQDVLNLNMKGQAVFDELPAEVRAAYGNNYMSFIMNPETAMQMLAPNNVEEIENEIVKEEEADDNS